MYLTRENYITIAEMLNQCRLIFWRKHNLYFSKISLLSHDILQCVGGIQSFEIRLSFNVLKINNDTYAF